MNIPNGDDVPVPVVKARELPGASKGQPADQGPTRPPDPTPESVAEIEAEAPETGESGKREIKTSSVLIGHLDV
jgi:hypothetical protein